MNIPPLHPDELDVGNKIRNYYFQTDPLATANKTQILHVNMSFKSFKTNTAKRLFIVY